MADPYLAARVEGHRVVEAWGPFATPEAAAEWLGGHDERLRDFIWERSGDQWFALVEEGDMEQGHYHIRPLRAPRE